MLKSAHKYSFTVVYVDYYFILKTFFNFFKNIFLKTIDIVLRPCYNKAIPHRKEGRKLKKKIKKLTEIMQELKALFEELGELLIKIAGVASTALILIQMFKK